MSLLSSLLLLILSARILGEVFKRFRQPSLMGEILAGILVGPSVLNLVKASPQLSGISDLAMFLIILSAGLEMEFNEILRSFRGKGLVVAFIGFIIPLVSGILVGLFFDLDRMRTVFLGLCISITALPVAIRILKTFDLLQHPIGQYSIVTAVVNDVLALFALGIILNLPSDENFSQLGMNIGIGVAKLIALALLILAMNYGLEKAESRGLKVRWVAEKLAELFGKEALLGMLIIFVLTIGSLSELLGSHFVIGAFFGALLIDRKLFLTSRFDEIDQSLSSISSGFLAPIFFVYLGLEFNLHTLPEMPLLVSILIVSIASKIFAGWLAGQVVGLKNPLPLGIGIILNGRGVMELVVANIAYHHGFISEGLFSSLVLMGIATTFVTPVLFRQFVAPHLSS
ncbi:MAG: cation:proton antiporter [Bdellovibrio sp.]|nr:MAG: cation:proton antiporter [Bdellovibrio sp.]